MSDNRANIKVSQEFYEEHKDRKETLGLTWEEYIDGQAPELPAADVDYAEIERRVERVVEAALNGQ